MFFGSMTRATRTGLNPTCQSPETEFEKYPGPVRAFIWFCSFALGVLFWAFVLYLVITSL
ncbi:hypothetical protein D3C87_1237770 [compost metagenome]